MSRELEVGKTYRITVEAVFRGLYMSEPSDDIDTLWFTADGEIYEIYKDHENYEIEEVDSVREG